MSTSTSLEAPPPVLKTHEKIPMQPEEAAASLNVLVYFARSSGGFTPEERAVIEETFQGTPLPFGLTFEKLLNANIDLDVQLQRIVSPDARERTYNAAYCLAQAGPELSSDRLNLLDRIREGLHISEERATLVGRMFADARDWLVPLNINPIADPEKREAAIHDYILRLSVISGIAGAVAIPAVSILTDMVVVSLQVKMVRDIGQYWGHKVDREAAHSIVGSILGATGIRIAVHSLLNVIPMLGMAVGAAASFGSTWALGKVAHRYFASNGALSKEDLKVLYEKAKLDAKSAYETSKHAITDGINKEKKP